MYCQWCRQDFVTDCMSSYKQCQPAVLDLHCELQTAPPTLVCNTAHQQPQGNSQVFSFLHSLRPWRRQDFVTGGK